MFMRGPHDPIRIERAEGPWLYASDGNKILDAGAGAVVVNIGQGRREIAEVAARTIANLDYIVPVWTSPEREKLVDRLTRWTPAGLTRFFFTSGGSEAVEAALKFAILYNKARGKQTKSKIIGRRFSYHGNTIAALSAGGSGRRADYEHILLDWPKIDPTYCYRCPWGKTYPSCEIDCATALEKEILKHGPDSIAAFIAEPMMGSSGGVVPPVKEYWPKIREICTRYDVLLIADEVMTGWGRTGKWFAMDHWGVKPDMLTTAKGITSAYVPLGLCATTEKIAAYFDDHYFAHGHTYEAHPLTLKPAVATIAEMKRLDLVNRAAELEPYMRTKLEALKEKHPSIGDVRGMGLFWAVELVKNRITKQPFNTMRDKVEGKSLVVDQIAAHMMKNGVTQQAWVSHFVIAPPLIVTKEEIDIGIAAMDQALPIADALVES